jgi:predicted ATPase
MAIEKIQINNFKSLVDLTIENPNPFTVFVGPNASGKSNIFEALEFFSFLKRFGFEETVSSFFDKGSILNYSNPNRSFKIQIKFSDINTYFSADKNFSNQKIKGFPRIKKYSPGVFSINIEWPVTEIPFFEEFSKLYIKNKEKVRMVNISDNRLSADAGNLEKVLKRLLMEPFVKEEFIELVSFLIPELENIEVISSDLSGSLSLQLFEKHSKKPFSRSLISDGTFNIIALLTSVYQSYYEGSFQRQFLCIEEPENGIHPEAIKELVYFFREQCENNGHYIWLTTHSQSLVSVLKPEEIIVVDKIKGETKIKQFQGEEFYSLKMDDAWLSNVLGGGLI